jgi:spermidine dehydrogenase
MTKKAGRTPTEHELGMDRAIPRRDFLNGAAMTIAAALVPHALQTGRKELDEPQNGADTIRRLRRPARKPSRLLKLPTACATARSENCIRTEKLAEKYDLIVVGAGISGLAAAYLPRAGRHRGENPILENHDDFGGHAKRNEFHLGETPAIERRYDAD